MTNAKYSFLSTNYASGVSSLTLVNSNGFSDNDYIILGNFGSETAEIVQISTINTSTHVASLASATKFSHSESTKVTIIRYNQVKFYHATAASYVGSLANSTLLSTVNVEADGFQTKYYDASNTTGFGWFVFYNSATDATTQASNAIPYAGFGQNSVKKIMDDFFSLLNSKDLKLITNTDAFSWLNEAYSIVINELNLVNSTYNVDDGYDIDVSANTKEYALPSDFSQVISVYDENNDIQIEPIGANQIDVNDYTYSGLSSMTKYYIRGTNIGFSPTPSDSRTYVLRYKKKSGILTSYYDDVNVPNNNYYILKDYMMFRAAEKLNKPNANMYLDLFNESIKRMKVNSNNEDGGPDDWGIAPEANI